jgi:hypothetical protein
VYRPQSPEYSRILILLMNHYYMFLVHLNSSNISEEPSSLISQTCRNALIIDLINAFSSRLFCPFIEGRQALSPGRQNLSQKGYRSITPSLIESPKNATSPWISPRGRDRHNTKIREIYPILMTFSQIGFVGCWQFPIRFLEREGIACHKYLCQTCIFIAFLHLLNENNRFTIADT